MVGPCTHCLSWFGSGCHVHIAQFVIATLAAVLQPKIRLSHHRDWAPLSTRPQHTHSWLKKALNTAHFSFFHLPKHKLIAWIIINYWKYSSFLITLVVPHGNHKDFSCAGRLPFGPSVQKVQVCQLHKQCIPVITVKTTNWCMSMWNSWNEYQENTAEHQDSQHPKLQQSSFQLLSS